MFVGNSRKFQQILILILSLVGIFVVGLREHAGVDWDSYIEIYKNISKNIIHPYPSFIEISKTFNSIEPGFWLLNKLSILFNGGVYMVNFICASIVFGCCYFFCSQQKHSLLTFICLSYIIFFINMNFSRQVVAISILLVGITYLNKKNYLKYCACAFGASVFHYPALLMLSLLLADIKGLKYLCSNKYIKIILLAILVCMAVTFINKFIIYFIWWFWSKEYYFQSDFLNYFLNFISVILFFKYKKQYQLIIPEWIDILNLSCKFVVVILIMCMISPIGSTRILFYFGFVQAIILPNFINIISKKRVLYIAGLIIVYIGYMCSLLSHVYPKIQFYYGNIIFS